MTDADRHQRTSDLFQRALSVPAGARAAWLQRSSADTALRATVASLLVQHEQDSFLDQPILERPPGGLGDPAGDNAANTSAARDLLIGQTVGPWRLTGLLGHGGMGAVYHAERTDATFQQSAALKLVRPGLGETFLARFVRERAVLAGLDHPGIARLLDGGIAPGGTPYLAMELVRGEPITTHARGLEVKARLDLFMLACDAVAYAHRNLVVHRDLKPDHIVVVGEADAPLPARTSSVPPAGDQSVQVKLLDFGVVKLLDSDSEMLTQTGQGPLTPAYASPEQLLGGTVTTATDVYALGVVLYELLAGQRPYTLGTLTAAQVERVVCETDPPPPSAAAEAPGARALRGDLDAIVMKALAKEPARRYASADALADDVRRHLAGEPVLARPATTRYRAGRFMRRHAVAVAAAVLVVLATSVGAGVAVWQAREARAAEQATAREAERAEAVAGFLESILRAPNARWYVDAEAKGPDTPIRVVLDEAAARIDRDFADRPDLRADLHHIVADTYVSMGMVAEAKKHHRLVLPLRQRVYTAPHPKIAEALYYAGGIERDPALRVPLMERAAAMLRQTPGGNNLPFVLDDLGGIYASAGYPEHAQAVHREAFDYVEARFTAGTDGFRYRKAMLTRLAYRLASEALDLDDIGEATRWIRVANESDASAAGDALCIRGRWRLARGERDAAERLFLACFRHGAQSTIDGGSSAARHASYRLTALYDAEDRPELASPYREGANNYTAALDLAARAVAPLMDARPPSDRAPREH